MDARRNEAYCDELKRMIESKEEEIRQEYWRLGVIAVQQAEASSHKIDSLTDELVALKQTLAKLETPDPGAVPERGG